MAAPFVFILALAHASPRRRRPAPTHFQAGPSAIVRAGVKLLLFGQPWPATRASGQAGDSITRAGGPPQPPPSRLVIFRVAERRELDPGDSRAPTGWDSRVWRKECTLGGGRTRGWPSGPRAKSRAGSPICNSKDGTRPLNVEHASGNLRLASLRLLSRARALAEPLFGRWAPPRPQRRPHVSGRDGRGLWARPAHCRCGPSWPFRAPA